MLRFAIIDAPSTLGLRPTGVEELPQTLKAAGLWTALNAEYAGRVDPPPYHAQRGRRTYEIFAAHWPFVKTKEDPIAAGINNAKKYVASKTLKKLDWSNSELIKGDVAKEVKKLKEQDGPGIQVHGSGNLIQTLLKHDLVDELWLKIFPITTGGGKRLFAEGTIPVRFKLLESKTSPTGVLIASYARAGDVKTGSFALEPPTEAELARRKRLREGK
jgi:dihydrofolate reductase